MDVKNINTGFVFFNIRGKHAERCASSPDFEILKFEEDEQHLKKNKIVNFTDEQKLLGNIPNEIIDTDPLPDKPKPKRKNKQVKNT